MPVPVFTGHQHTSFPRLQSCRLPVKGKDDKWSLLALVSEVVREGHSVLIFCASRHAAQSCAAMLSKELAAYVGKPSQEQKAAREELVSRLIPCTAAVMLPCETLQLLQIAKLSAMPSLV
eukprot:GHUV01028184.1.p3 GENE.GHUV01028184.1~~GHUV01028184.1.p3  ORF type:complete len:120 (-),score=27.01 GHUV01028184.1:33-392(-)